VEPICLQGRTLSGDDLTELRALMAQHYGVFTPYAGAGHQVLFAEARHPHAGSPLPLRRAGRARRGNDPLDRRSLVAQKKGVD